MNAIVICLDTLRWDFLGCYGANPWIRTPLIDGYAARATRFDAAYCGSFPTVPMRVDAYTGNVNWPRYGWQGPEPEQPVLPAILREHGVRTALVLDTANNVGAGLHECYDEHVLIKKPETNTAKPEEIEFPFPREMARQNGNLYARDMANTAHYRHESDWFVARTMLEASRWLEGNARREPFFLWVDTFEIHEVWRAPEHYIRMYSPDYEGIDYPYPNYGPASAYQPHELERLRARYAAEVTLTDRWVGHLLRQIEYQGLFENTLVILTSDHGMYLGEHDRVGKHTVTAGDPWPIYDTVGRVPLLAWSPYPAAPRATGALVQAADLMPTILDACGVEYDAPCGRSWLPVLRGDAGRHADAVYTSRYSGHMLFTSCHSGEGSGRIGYLNSLITVTTPRWSAIFGPPPHTPELYDRAWDPEQQENMAARHPSVVRGLREALAAFMRERGAGEAYVREYALGEG